MRYFAEHLRNLKVVNLQIELEKTEKVWIRPASTSKLAEFGTSSHNILEVYKCNSAATDFVELPATVSFAPQELCGQTIRLRLNTLPENSIPTSIRTPPFEPPKFSNGEPLVKPAAFVNWKPLPSEHWAELMDAWHCHKPQHEAQKALDQGLYGLAMNGFHAQPGLAYYSETYYLVHRSDLNPSTASRFSNNSPNSVKVWRWELGVPISNVIRTMLREKIDAHAVYTILINQNLAIWVLNGRTDCGFTGTSPHYNVMKVLYADTRKTPGALTQRPDPEPVEIPVAAAESLLTSLVTVNAQLPFASRTMNGWCVSII